jgi:prephenate dehydrogenase
MFENYEGKGSDESKRMVDDMASGAITSPTVGIIGGTGQLGSWCAEVFRKQGCPIFIADRGTELNNREVVARSDIVVVSVPIGVTGVVLEEVTPSLRPEQLIVDLTSVKTPFVPLMESSKAEVLSVHPMFAPSISSQSAQTCIVCPVRERRLAGFFTSVLEREGLRLVTMAPDAHDRMMAVVQGLTHFQAIAAAHCMAAMNFQPAESLESASPVYRLRLAMIGRILAQSPRLYAEIQIFNPYVAEVLERLQLSHERLMAFVTAKDVDGFVAEFERVRDALGTFGQESISMEYVLEGHVTARKAQQPR